MQKTLFISDLHLSPQSTEINQLFINFLQQKTGDIDALYILGDLFEVWVGDVDDNFNASILQAISAASQNCPIYFMYGNRDFMLSKKVAKKAGMRLLPDPSVIELYSRKILLMHGDSLCSEDKMYQFYRYFVQSRLSQWIYLSLPLAWRQNIANGLRQQSKQRTQTLPAPIMDTHLPSLLKAMKKHQVDFLIHGHTHKPSIRYFWPEQKQIIVLSDWYKQGNVLTVNQDGSYRLSYFL
ncbi:MAG: UDP-2,3-diacylglucosamine diphosphatase [Pseudomonadota bacterium]